jgi:TetR/AcrR family acrAB operon transcriptional repressor
MTDDVSLLERPGRRAEQAAATRQRLIEAAMRLFAQQGYTASSVAAIGEQAGVSRGLVNFHFATKENLLHAVIEQLVSELERQMFPGDAQADPLEALAVLVQAHRRFLQQQPERARLLFRLQAEALNPMLGLEAFADLHRRWLERTRPWWEQMLAERRIDPELNHNAVATFTIGALRGIALEWLLAPDAVDLDAAYQHLFRSLEAGLTQGTDSR